MVGLCIYKLRSRLEGHSSSVTAAYPGCQVHLVIKENNEELALILRHGKPVCQLLHGSQQGALLCSWNAAQARLAPDCLAVPLDGMVQQLGKDIERRDQAIKR